VGGSAMNEAQRKSLGLAALAAGTLAENILLDTVPGSMFFAVAIGILSCGLAGVAVRSGWAAWLAPLPFLISLPFGTSAAINSYEPLPIAGIQIYLTPLYAVALAAGIRLSRADRDGAGQT